MSAGAGTEHIKAAEALEKSFAADGRVAEVINNDALQYTLPFKLERLLKDPDGLVRMKANALRFAKPTATTTIFDTLLEDCLPHYHSHKINGRRLPWQPGLSDSSSCKKSELR